MARLDIAEKRIPQDGRISLSIGGRSIDVRVSTLPSRYGERVTMRLLDTRNALLGLDELGMDAEGTLDRASARSSRNRTASRSSPVRLAREKRRRSIPRSPF